MSRPSATAKKAKCKKKFLGLYGEKKLVGKFFFHFIFFRYQLYNNRVKLRIMVLIGHF